MQDNLRPLSNAEISQVSGADKQLRSVIKFAVECVLGGGTMSTGPAPFKHPTCTTPVKD